MSTCDRSDCDPSTCTHSSHRPKVRRDRLDEALAGIDLATLPVGLRPGTKVGPRRAPRVSLFPKDGCL